MARLTDRTRAAEEDEEKCKGCVMEWLKFEAAVNELLHPWMRKDET